MCRASVPFNQAYPIATTSPVGSPNPLHHHHHHHHHHPSGGPLPERMLLAATHANPRQTTAAQGPRRRDCYGVLRRPNRPLRVGAGAMAQDASATAGAAAAEAPRVVICGAGIVGAATAYYLSELGVAATIVERETVACAASGKAGGFLALSWNDGGPVGPLARVSYALHQQLAKELGDVGYRPVNTLQVVGAATPPPPGRRRQLSAPLPTWLDGHVIASRAMGSTSDTAQVHPAKLTSKLVAAAQERGATLVTGTTVTGVVTLQCGGGQKVTGVKVEDAAGNARVLEADAVVIAMGPWSGAARAWLPLPPFSGQKYHSVVLLPPDEVSADCVFTSFTAADGRTVDPEIYPRPDGTVYVCGEAQALDLPPSPSGVTVEPGLAQNVTAVAAALSSVLARAEVTATQACYLPLSPDGAPVIGRVPGVEGAYVAAGHGCWGILNGPATGLGLAELIVRGRSDAVDLSAFDPARLRRCFSSAPPAAQAAPV